MKIKIFLLAISSFSSLAQSTISTNFHNAWSGNTGWIEFRTDRPNSGDGARVADTVLSGNVWSADTGWINLGDGSPANGIRYGNTNSTDFGVNVDAAGNLGGLAWSANTGWINFGWAATNDIFRPRMNFANGFFFGYAWSANLGWINLGNTRLQTESIAITDTDGDGISDAWELEKADNLIKLTANGDADGDGRKDVAEYIADTNPVIPDAGLTIVSISCNTPAQQTFVEWTSMPSRIYGLQSRTNLTTGAWGLLGNYQGDVTPTTTAVTASAGPQNFYRVQAKLPLTP